MNAPTTTGEGIDYDPSQNPHPTSDSQAAVKVMFAEGYPKSVLDVGCGPGTWLRTIAEAGVADYYGVDGIDHLPKGDPLFGPERFKQIDLRGDWDLGRRFDVALCLEVAEHLDAGFAKNIVRALARHADTVYFSAACPGQPGQHHVNCQWPEYWQELFNAEGFACDDAVRWCLWEVPGLSPWYKQNMFMAQRMPKEAGREPRVKAVVHPEMMPCLAAQIIEEYEVRERARIAGGKKKVDWYFRVFLRGLATKLARAAGLVR